MQEREDACGWQVCLPQWSSRWSGRYLCGARVHIRPDNRYGNVCSLGRYLRTDVQQANATPSRTKGVSNTATPTQDGTPQPKTRAPTSSASSNSAPQKTAQPVSPSIPIPAYPSRTSTAKPTPAPMQDNGSTTSRMVDTLGRLLISARQAGSRLQSGRVGSTVLEAWIADWDLRARVRSLLSRSILEISRLARLLRLTRCRVTFTLQRIIASGRVEISAAAGWTALMSLVVLGVALRRQPRTVPKQLCIEQDIQIDSQWYRSGRAVLLKHFGHADLDEMMALMAEKKLREMRLCCAGKRTWEQFERT